MGYKYGILRTDDSPEADEHNDKLLGETTLGVEVIKSILAKRCGLGNIDPQHGGDYNSSAIEDALTFSPLPPDGAHLVTVRPDRDSLGAMAVLNLRAQGKTIDTKLVTWIGRLDLMGGSIRLVLKIKSTERRRGREKLIFSNSNAPDIAGEGRETSFPRYTDGKPSWGKKRSCRLSASALSPIS